MRIDQAIAGLPRTAPLVEPLRSRLDAVDRVSRYKIERLRESSRMLESYDTIDAIGAFSRRERPLLREPEPWRAIADPAVESLPDGLRELPAELALPILVHAPPAIEAVPAERAAELHAAALSVAACFRHEPETDHVAALIGGFGLAPPMRLGHIAEGSIDATIWSGCCRRSKRSDHFHPNPLVTPTRWTSWSLPRSSISTTGVVCSRSSTSIVLDRGRRLAIAGANAPVDYAVERGPTRTTA